MKIEKQAATTNPASATTKVTTEFDSFRQLTKTILAVPKDELSKKPKPSRR